MAAMDELGTQLQSLQALKPPGVTPTKIKAITQLCVDNIQSHPVIVQKIVQQLQNSAVTHKLGVLYVVDAVARQWVERAKQAGQTVSKNAVPGTYVSGVQMMRDVLPAMMMNLIQSAPETQKEKISKLIDIWERGQTFPHDMLALFKQQLNGGHNSVPLPVEPLKSNGAAPAFNGQTANPQPLDPPPPAQSSQDTNALFAALAGISQQNIPTNAPHAAPAFPFQQNILSPPPGFVPPPPAVTTGQPGLPVPPAGMNELAGQILQAMSVGSIQPDQAIQVLNALATAQNGGLPMLPLQPPVATQTPPQGQSIVINSNQTDRYDQTDSRMRDRSRSPGFQRRRSPGDRSPTNPNRRESPTYGVYDPNAGPEGNSQRFERGERGRSRGKQKGGRNDRSEYRQRSPPRRQPSPPRAAAYGQSKYIDWDETLPRDNIRVLSRTLFVGGAGGTESEIRSIFSRFGRVQTCIVNQDKRHAFVKMLTRPDALAAKQGMDSLNDPVAQSKARQTRWGVGFGPRDCSDYQTGISVIPISRLTEADRKWALTAEYGGTGGRALEGGMVIEEPDIEIGAGVSSKAISRRMPTAAPRGGRGGYGVRGDHAGRGNSNGRENLNERADAAPNNFGGSRPGPENTAQHKLRKHDRGNANDPRHVSPRADQGVAVPPAVPGFGFQLPGFS